MISAIRFSPRLAATLVALAAALPWAPVAFAQTENPGGSPAAAAPMTPAEKDAARQALLKLAADGLEKLYKTQPEARQSVESAAGYAVFDISSIYAIAFVGQRGQGVMFDNASKKPTFMSSVRAGTGPGIGKQRVYQVFVFKSKGAMDQFVAAGGTGGDVSMGAGAGRKGVVRSINPSIDIHQIHESGMALQASWGGTVYSADRDLN